ncbi:MAG: hypothetical protein A3J24_00115 [Deltaproteobacteria bacterium RIFCSPLOWO2_02_FULL_53_8]|nr:MAG: hypothetical protein A3J24_00115 [Deltaproteobacteria bacterium RIFCSPLOWO2_02_FULL_53_8]
MVKIKLPVNLALSVCLVATLISTASCSPTTTGAVKDDVSITGQSQRLEETGAQYNGPQYNVAILMFANKTPSRAIGLGEAATDILRTIVKKSGLEPITMSDDEMRQQEKMIALQQSGAVKTGRKDAAEGFEPVDYRISGSITSYAELEEGSNVLVAQSKTQVARVQVDYALVDVATGRSLVAESGMGEYRKKTGGVLGLGSKSTADVGLREGALRDALTKAMTRMIEKLNQQPFSGRVLAVEGSTIVIKAGTRSRLPEGTVFDVLHPGQDLIDPDTGRVIGKRDKKVGEITLTSHQNDKISEATVRAGSGFQAGDMIRQSR